MSKNKMPKTAHNPFNDEEEEEEDTFVQGTLDAILHTEFNHDGETVKLITSKCYDTTRDLLFVRLVAGRLNRERDTLIVRKAISIKRRRVKLTETYEYQDSLLSAWMGTVERVKKAIREEDEEKWRSTRYCHDKLVMTDTTCVPFAHYVAYTMMTVGARMAPASKTRFDITVAESEHASLLADLLRGIHKEYGVIHPVHVAENFGSEY